MSTNTSASSDAPREMPLEVTPKWKSTLAAELARRLDAEFVELDALFWLPGWEQVSTDAFRERVSEAIAVECWVVGGNYSRARDLIWSAADTLIWLATSPELQARSGGYYVQRREVPPSRRARDEESARRLWELSEQLVDQALAQ